MLRCPSVVGQANSRLGGCRSRGVEHRLGGIVSVGSHFSVFFLGSFISAILGPGPPEQVHWTLEGHGRLISGSLGLIWALWRFVGCCRTANWKLEARGAFDTPTLVVGLPTMAGVRANPSCQTRATDGPAALCPVADATWGRFRREPRGPTEAPLLRACDCKTRTRAMV